MKKPFLPAIGALAVVALLLLYFSRGPTSLLESPSTQNPSAQNSSGDQPAAATLARKAAPATAPPADAALSSAASSSPQSPDLSARAGQYIPPGNANTNVPPFAAVQNIRRAVRQYGQMFGGDPVGNNQEITAQLTGSNPKQINFLTGQDGMTINQNGELVDQWGTPYFFHQLSGSDMEVRSAGPDKRMWTSDDVVTR